LNFFEENDVDYFLLFAHLSDVFWWRWICPFDFVVFHVGFVLYCFSSRWLCRLRVFMIRRLRRLEFIWRLRQLRSS